MDYSAAVADTIRKLIAEGRYEEAQELLPAYSQAAVQYFHEARSEKVLLDASDFVRDCLCKVRLQRAHDSHRLGSVRCSKAYSGFVTGGPRWQVSG